MPELTIKYKSSKTLKLLEEFAKQFGYVITSRPAKTEKAEHIIVNGVQILPADPKIDTSSLSTIFTGKNVNSEELRTNSWQRNS